MFRPRSAEFPGTGSSDKNAVKGKLFFGDLRPHGVLAPWEPEAIERVCTHCHSNPPLSSLSLWLTPPLLRECYESASLADKPVLLSASSQPLPFLSPSRSSPLSLHFSQLRKGQELAQQSCAPSSQRTVALMDKNRMCESFQLRGHCDHWGLAEYIIHNIAFLSEWVGTQFKPKNRCLLLT